MLEVHVRRGTSVEIAAAPPSFAFAVFFPDFSLSNSFFFGAFELGFFSGRDIVLGNPFREAGLAFKGNRVIVLCQE
jgi:hypothetical protein